jgi:hypothetical protein
MSSKLMTTNETYTHPLFKYVDHVVRGTRVSDMTSYGGPTIYNIHRIFLRAYLYSYPSVEEWKEDGGSLVEYIYRDYGGEGDILDYRLIGFGLSDEELYEMFRRKHMYEFVDDNVLYKVVQLYLASNGIKQGPVYSPILLNPGTKENPVSIGGYDPNYDYDGASIFDYCDDQSILAKYEEDKTVLDKDLVSNLQEEKNH